MKVSTLKWTALAIIILLFAPAGSRAAEQKKDNWLGLFTGVGFGDEEIVGIDQGGHGTPLLGLRWEHYFCYDRAFFADVSYIDYESTRAFGDTQEFLSRFGGMKLFGKDDGSNWFINAGAGYFHYDPRRAPYTQGLMVGAGFGQRFVSSHGGSAIQWEIRPDLILDSLEPSAGNMLNLKATVGWSWGSGRFGDEDGDGVADCKDQCQATPKGAIVDEKGCPKDTDGDGVYDGLDRCPDTPRGWPVDRSGCPKDTDGDGVPDGGDACPNTPAGAQVDAKGCPKDTDGDGVYDGIDRCPDTPRGAQVDAKGCPKDTDGDGVYDGIDRCPDTPRGAKVDFTGCPIPEPPKAAPIFEPGKKSLVLEGVNFEFDKAVLTPDSSVVLDRVAASLKDWPEVRVEVDGYTDSVGSDEHNLGLSERRAEAVEKYLSEHGVDPSRLRAKGFGKSNPVADNGTKEGRAKNRRVELSKAE